ncbi:hypothetical protein IQ255_30830 [Pleurocapsales cyanobacterium LEGE 10410]|nr:hypothetical protein [Pleurocapsales cyanobacterium LEGE 10410]
MERRNCFLKIETVPFYASIIPILWFKLQNGLAKLKTPYLTTLEEKLLAFLEEEYLNY